MIHCKTSLLAAATASSVYNLHWTWNGGHTAAQQLFIDLELFSRQKSRFGMHVWASSSLFSCASSASSFLAPVFAFDPPPIFCIAPMTLKFRSIQFDMCNLISSPRFPSRQRSCRLISLSNDLQYKSRLGLKTIPPNRHHITFPQQVSTFFDEMMHSAHP